MERSDIQPSSKESLQQLIEGNQRFVRGLRSIEAMQSVMKLKELAEKGQKPFAIILTCSDSRIPTEILFDRGVGDLFVIRSAGNLVDMSALASIEFAVAAFATPLVLVMGHTGCGAIRAAQDHARGKARNLTPALEMLLKKVVPDALANVNKGVKALSTKSALIRERVAAGQLLVLGSCVDIHTGEVRFELPPGLDPEIRQQPAGMRRAATQASPSAPARKFSTKVAHATRDR